MKKYEGYAKAEAFTGDYETITPGGYVCIIKGVLVEEKPYGNLMRIGFDIAEGEHKDFYKRQFDKKKESNPDAKWPGMYYQTIKEGEDIKYFKGFMSAIESSNQGYKWDWDENKLVGKTFGGIFGQEEYMNSNNEIKLATKCMFVKSVETVKSGNFKVPDIKKLNNSSYSFVPVTDNMSNYDDELPF